MPYGANNKYKKIYDIKYKDGYFAAMKVFVKYAVRTAQLVQ